MSGTRETAAERGRTPPVPASRRAIVGKETDLRRRSDGREPWGFRARSVSDLLGVHAAQVERALEGEHAHYLVYLPMWDGRRAPFGVAATPASHALAVTAERLVISRDAHVAGEPPSCATVPFAALLALGWGSSLMMGWLRVMWIDGGRSRSTALLYRASTGQRHVQAVVRAMRAAGPGADFAIGCDWGDVWNEAGRQFREEIEFALAPGERPLAARRTIAVSPTHAPRPQGRRSEATTLLVLPTDRGLLIGRTGGVRTGGGFGADVVFIPRALPSGDGAGENRDTVEAGHGR